MTITDDMIAALRSRLTANSYADDEECRAALAAALAAQRGAPVAVDALMEAHEQRDALRRALEIIAVGDAQDPQAQAAEELIALGYWRDITEARKPQRVPLTGPELSRLITEADADELCAVNGTALLRLIRFAEHAHGIGGEPPQRVPLTLPPLPVEHYVDTDGLWDERHGPYTADQMTAYARTCAAAWGITLADTEDTK